MKRLFTLFITVLSCSAASLQAMETAPAPNSVPSLQEMVIRKQLAQWEEKLRNAQTAEEHGAICAGLKKDLQNLYHGHEAIEELINGYITVCHIPRDTPKSLGNTYSKEQNLFVVITNSNELIIKKNSAERRFKMSSGWALISPDNAFFAIKKYCSDKNAQIIALYHITTDLSPLCIGYILLDMDENGYYWNFWWRDRGIEIEGSDSIVIANPIITAALSEEQAPDLSEPLLIEVSQRELFKRNARTAFKSIKNYFSLDSTFGKVMAHGLLFAGVAGFGALTGHFLNKTLPTPWLEATRAYLSRLPCFIKNS